MSRDCHPGGSAPPLATPCPERPTVCGLPEALLLICAEAAKVPGAVGAKTTSTVHALPGAMVAPEHVSAEMRNCVACAPCRLTPDTTSGSSPVLDTVIWFAALLVPTVVEG